MMNSGDGTPGSVWRSPWTAMFGLAACCVLSLLAMRGDAAEIVDPHDTSKPRFCINCHTEEIYTKICNENEGYCLLGGSVDGVCLICHIKEDCCKPGLTHLPKIHLGMSGHPSNVETRDIPRAYYPRTLPLHLGRITCHTCHLHTRETTGGYKMLRMVTITSKGVDWTILCHDCHKGL